MSEKDKLSLINYHREMHAIPELTNAVKPRDITTVMLVDGGNAGIVRSVLDWDEKHQRYTGKTYVGSKLLAGIKNLHIPQIAIYPETGDITFTLHIDNCMITQRADKEAYSHWRQPTGIGRHFLDVLTHRVSIAHKRHNNMWVSEWEHMTLDHLRDILKSGKLIKTYPNGRKETWEIINTVVSEELPTIDEIKHDGLLIKKTLNWFGAGKQKEEIEYYSMEATGRFTVFTNLPGARHDFRFHTRVGYLALAPLK